MLSLWQKWNITPDDIISKRDNGLNSVNSIHKIEKATEIMGVYGKKWGIKKIKIETLVTSTSTIATGGAIFFSKKFKIKFEIGGSVLIERDGYINDDFVKDLETSMITKALSRLGLFADSYTDIEIEKSEEQKETELSQITFSKIGENNE